MKNKSLGIRFVTIARICNSILKNKIHFLQHITKAALNNSSKTAFVYGLSRALCSAFVA